VLRIKGTGFFNWSVVTGFLILLLMVTGCLHDLGPQNNDESSALRNDFPPIITDCHVTYFDKTSSGTVLFSGLALDPDGAIISYTWVLSDGTQSNQSSFTHSFTTPGTYTASLTVTDDAGAQDEETIEVIIYHTE
jgi:hypothetical protein